MLVIPKSKQFQKDGETYSKNISVSFPDGTGCTFIKLNTVLERNTKRELNKLAKGLSVPRFSTYTKKDLVTELQKHIKFL